MNINQKNNNGVKIGYWKECYSDGQLWRKGEYNEKGQRIGYWETFYPDGKLWSKGEYNDNGQRIGYWIQCFFNVNKKGNYYNGKRIGYWEVLNNNKGREKKYIVKYYLI